MHKPDLTHFAETKPNPLDPEPSALSMGLQRLEQTNRWTNERTTDRTDEQKNERTNDRSIDRTDERKNERTNERSIEGTPAQTKGLEGVTSMADGRSICSSDAGAVHVSETEFPSLIPESCKLECLQLNDGKLVWMNDLESLKKFVENV